MIKLPLKLKVGIRDCWDPPSNTPKARACNQLVATIGYPIRVQPEWLALLGELGSFYPDDKAQLATGLATVVECFCLKLDSMVNEHQPYEGFQDAVVDWFATSGCIALHFSVSATMHTTVAIRKGTGPDESSIIILLPRGKIQGKNEMMPAFEIELQRFFCEKSSVGETPATTQNSNKIRNKEENEELDRTTNVLAPVADTPISPANSGVDSVGTLPGSRVVKDIAYMPDVNTMPGPAELLSRPPYHLIVHGATGQQITVESSHSQTLVVLAEYLNKWARIDHNNYTHPPQVKAILENSSFGLSVMPDRLVIKSTASIYHATVTMILALIEGSFGYQPVYSQSSSNGFVYRKDTEFT